MTATTLVRLGERGARRALAGRGRRAPSSTRTQPARSTNTSDTILYADDFDYSGKTVPVIGAGGADHGDRRLRRVARRLAERDSALHLRSQRRLRGLLAQRLQQLRPAPAGGSVGHGARRHLEQRRSRSPASATTDGSTTRPASTSHSRTTAPRAATTTPRSASRQQGGSNSHTMSGTPYFLKYTFDGGWQLLVDGASVASGNVVSGAGGVTIAGFKAAYNAVAQPGHPGRGQQGDCLPGRCDAGRLHRSEASGCPGGSIWPAATTSPSSTT